MPYKDELRSELESRLHALNPDLRLVEPEEEGFPEFLREVTQLDSSLAQAIDVAIVDEQAEEARLAFGGVDGASMAGVVKTVGRKVQGQSVRGQPRVRPVTLGIMLAGLVGGVLAITAVLPERKSSDAAKTPPAVVEPSHSSATGDHPEATVSAQPAEPAAQATQPAGMTEAAPITASAPPPVTAEPVGYVGQSAAPAPTPAVSPAPVASSEVSPESLQASYSVPASQAAPAAPVQSPVSVPAQPQGTVVRLAPAGSGTEGLRTSGAAAESAEKADGLVSSPEGQEADAQVRAGLISSGGGSNGEVQRSGLVSGAGAEASSARREGLVSSGTSAEQRVALVSDRQEVVASRGGLVTSGETSSPRQESPVAQAGAAQPVSQPGAGQTPGDLVPAADAPYAPGTVVKAQLDMAVGVFVGANQPVWARGEDGSVWRGEATVDAASQRIMMTFRQVMKYSKVSPVTAYVESRDGVGIGGRTRQVSRDVGRAVMNSLLNAAVGFVQSQAAQTTTITSSAVVQSQQPQNFWLAMGGGLAQAFVIPDVKASAVMLGELPLGESILIRVDLSQP